MLIDLTNLSEDELIELNCRIVERLQLIGSAKRLAQLARFSVGMTVEFDTDDGRTARGTVARINRQTATVVAESGRWRVSPSLLRTVEPPRASTACRDVEVQTTTSSRTVGAEEEHPAILGDGRLLILELAVDGQARVEGLGPGVSMVLPGRDPDVLRASYTPDAV